VPRFVTLRATRLVLAAAVVASCAARIALGTRVNGPWIFPDELGYQQIAANIARGHLALYGRTGLSYSPFYSLLLSPLFAAGLSAPSAYEGIKVVNAILMSLALLPTYGIARFLLPRRPSLVVVALAALAPLMYTTTLGMSENAAYPLFLVAAWLLLRTLAHPSRVNDALFVGATVVACAARIQLVVFVPAAISALALLALVETRSLGRRFVRAARTLASQHVVLVAGCCLIAVAALAPALIGSGAFSAAGRYSNVPAKGNGGGAQIAKLFVYHTAGLVIVAGVMPFIATAAAALVWLRRAAAGRTAMFAATALTLTLWLLAETAFAVNAFERQGDAPRIHERYLFYLVPFFLTGLLAALRDERVRASRGSYVVATAVSALAVLAIPFRTIINGTIVADSFSFELFARNVSLQAVSHAAALAAGIVFGAGLLLLVARRQPLLVLGAVAAAFVFLSYREAVRVEAAANGHRSFTVATSRDWVDQADPTSSVAMVVGPAVTDPVAEWQTDYDNLTIHRLYYVCHATLSADFGEQQVSVGDDGVVRAGGAPLATRYAVVPANLGVQGVLLGRDPVARLELVRTDGTLRVDPRLRDRWQCP
jgi:hypothetical protein